jgi:hypothetical protein
MPSRGFHGARAQKALEEIQSTLERAAHLAQVIRREIRIIELRVGKPKPSIKPLAKLRKPKKK